MALYNNCLFPVNMPDPAWVRPGSGQQAAGIGPDPISRIRFGSWSDAFFLLFSAQEVARIIIIGSESDPFLYIWPVWDIDATTWTERSQIRPVSGKTGRDHIRPAFLFRPDGHRPSRLTDYDHPDITALVDWA